MAHASPLDKRSRQAGFSLIELLVGVAVGMIGILIIFQTISVWNKHTQTTASGGDARTAGTLAMFNLERDLKLAGFGFAKAASQVMGCSIRIRVPLGAASIPMAPVRIGVNADGTGTIDVLYGNSSFFTSEETFTNATGTSEQVKRRGGFKAGDLAVIAGNAGASAASADCAMVEVTSASNPDGVTIDHQTGSYTSFYASSAASATFNDNSASMVSTSGTIYNFGPGPRMNHWEVKGNSLRSTDLIHGVNAFDVAEGVIDLQAQYGVDSNGDSQITDNEWTFTAPTDWTAVRAIRVALLVRSRQFEKAGDTPYAAASGASSAAVADPPTWFGMPFVMRNVDGTTDSYGPTSVDPNNWRFYRYRVYERVIPLRNMIWGTP